MKTLAILLAISNAATIVVGCRAISNIEECNKTTLKRIETKLDLLEKTSCLDRQAIETKLLDKEDVRQAVVGEVRAEIAKLPFTPINIKYRG